MENVTLTMSITAAEAAKAGVDKFGDVTVVVEPSKLSEGARAAYAALCGKSVKSDSTLRYGRRMLPLPVPVTAEAVAEWLEANAKDVADFDAREKASYAAKVEADRESVRKWAAKSDREMIGQTNQYHAGYQVNTPYSFPDDMKEFVKERAAKAQVLADQMNAEAAENVAKAKKVKEEAAARRAAQLAQWLETKASDSMRKRAARGLLPEEDLIAAIRNEAYAPLAEFKRFERLTDDDVRIGLDADESMDVDYTTREAESAHDEDIELMERIESLMPGAVCTLVEHAGWLTEANGKDDPEVTRYAVKVAIKVGELEFSREYLAG